MLLSFLLLLCQPVIHSLLAPSSAKSKRLICLCLTCRVAMITWHLLLLRWLIPEDLNLTFYILIILLRTHLVCWLGVTFPVTRHQVVFIVIRLRSIFQAANHPQAISSQLSQGCKPSRITPYLEYILVFIHNYITIISLSIQD